MTPKAAAASNARVIELWKQIFILISRAMCFAAVHLHARWTKNLCSIPRHQLQNTETQPFPVNK